MNAESPALHNPSSSPANQSWRALLHRVYTAHRPLVYSGAAMVALAIVSGVGILVDGRTVYGESTWLKPFKFGVSFALYTFTLAWMISLFSRWRRTLWWLGTGVGVIFVIPEMAVITLQAARGIPSHFNYATTFDSVMYGIMGGAAYAGWILTFALGVFLLLQRKVDRPLAWAIPLGIVVSLAGMSVGYLMTSPTPEQAQALDQGIEVGTIGAHTVGQPEDGDSLPVTSWSNEVGDLRVAHFVGIHALQILPLVAIGLRLLASARPTVLSSAVRTRLVLVTAASYAGLTGLLIWQALRGQPLLQWDSVTLGAVAGLAALTLLGAAVAVFSARHGSREDST